MKKLRISVDCSCFENNIKAIGRRILIRVKPILSYHFNVLSVDVVSGFINIDMDVENSTMEYGDMCNYCRELVQWMLIDQWDLIISVHQI